MIDSEMKSKILALYEQGNSKSFISKSTGVSLPSIRKVINDYKKESSKKSSNKSNIHEKKDEITDNEGINQTPTQDSQQETVLASELYPVDEFYINLTRYWPERDYSPHQQLRNGAPICNVPILLKQIYPHSPDITNEIIKQIYSQPPIQRVFKTSVTHRTNGHIVYVRPMKIIHEP